MTVPQEKLSGQVVLVGYGRVGRRIAAALMERGIPSSWPSRTAKWSTSCASRHPAVAGNAANRPC
jgi:CPA2 family monovalent cation:H+ antiporter-2